MSQRNTASFVIKKAIDRAEAHLAGERDLSLPLHLDAQVARFKDILISIERDITGECYASAPTGMRHAIADSWPFESELGKLISDAEVAYQRVLQSNSKPA